MTASGGAIAAITITSPGRGYTTAPSVIVRQTGTGNTAGVTFVGNATNFTVGGLTMTNAGSGYTGTPTITVGGLGGATATLSSVHLATDSSIGGSGNTTISSAVSGAGLSKVGAGTLTLTGANTYTGNTTVRAGTLKLDDAGNLINTANLIVGDAGSIGARLDVTTKTGGLSIGLAQTLSGIGQIDGNTIVLGTHAPGNSPGLQTFNGNLAYSTGSMLKWELATNSVGTRGTDFDGIDVIGAGVLSIATNVASNLIFNAVGSTVNWNNVFWQSNHSWLVFDNANLATHDSASIFDTINVSTDSVGATLTGGAFAWAQSGNDVFLNFTATTPVPEPTGVAVGLLCLGVATLRRKRRAAVAAELQA